MKPFATRVAMGRRAVVHEWAALKPCWEAELGREVLRKRRRRRSRILTVGHKSEMGR